jgi:hypothetical protein
VQVKRICALLGFGFGSFSRKLDYLFAATACITLRQAIGERPLVLASYLTISLRGGRQRAAHGKNSA